MHATSPRPHLRIARIVLRAALLVGLLVGLPPRAAAAGGALDDDGVETPNPDPGAALGGQPAAPTMRHHARM
ncbi:MAG: hypothetical protein AAF772_19550, partial [Acidobacteriota bacterium]